MNYLDSELSAGIYSESGGTGTTSVKIRATANMRKDTSDNFLDAELTEEEKKIWTQSTLGSDPKDCTPYLEITPFLSQYVSIKYDQLKTTPEKFEQGGQPIYPTEKTHPEIVALTEQYKYTPEGLGQQLIYMFGAEYISKIGKLENKYPSEVQISTAKRLTEIVLGQDDPNFFSNIPFDLSLDDSVNSANPKTLLKKIVLTGNKNLNTTCSYIDVGASSKLEEFRALNTNVSGCTLAIGCPISKLHLPASATSLILNTNYNLDKAIRENLASDELLATSGSIEGLYFEGLTDEIDETKDLAALTAAQGSGQFALTKIEIKNDGLGYDSYQILKLALAKKLSKTTPTSKPGLEIRLENVKWTPFEVLDTAAEIDNETTYYELNDHYQYVITDATDDGFAMKRANGLIYTKVNDKESQINSLEILDEFIKAKTAAGETEPPQFKDTVFNGNVPYLSGEIYVDNAPENPISELKIQEYNTYYPSLNIRVANVEKQHTIKYVQVDDVSGTTKVYYTQKAQNAQGKATDEGNLYFANPNRNVTLVPSKNNYDFFGWSTDGTKEKVIISPKEQDSEDYLDSVWEGIDFSQYEVDGVVVLYAAFELHKYNATFYNYDGTVLGTTQTPYSRVDKVNIINVIPSKPADELELTQTYGFAGWALKTAPNRLLDMSNVHPIMDYEFIAVYEEKSVYDNVLSTNYLTVVNLSNGGCQISLASGMKISGKITLPAVVNGRDVVSLGKFNEQSDLTHIFWSTGAENKVATITEDAFDNCRKLCYYEMGSASQVVIERAGFRYTRVLENMDPTLQTTFLGNVTTIKNAVFAVPFSGFTSSLRELHIPGTLKYLETQAFSNYKSLSSITIGSEDNPT